MNGSPSAILTLGLGAWGGPSLLLTLGYGIGSAAITPLPTLFASMPSSNGHLTLPINRGHITLPDQR